MSWRKINYLAVVVLSASLFLQHKIDVIIIAFIILISTLQGRGGNTLRLCIAKCPEYS